MHNRLKICGVAAAAIALSIIAPAAFGQGNTFTFTCQEMGSGAPTPPADRLGDLISVEQDRCTVDSGPLIGGVLVEVIIWEWDKTRTNAVLLSGSGVIRKPGSTLAFQITEGKMASIITDGKVTGATSSGRGNDGVATGGAASLAGKSYTWSTKSTGKLQFVLDVEME
jgi:hypothetical protein